MKSQNSVTSEEYREVAAGFTSEMLEKSVENEQYHKKSIEITENVLQKAYAENFEKFSRELSPEKSRKTSRPSTAESRIQSASKATPIESEASELSLRNEPASQDKYAPQRRPESGQSDLHQVEEVKSDQETTTNQSDNETNQADPKIPENRQSKVQSGAPSPAEDSKSPEMKNCDSGSKVPEIATDVTNETKDVKSDETKEIEPKSSKKDQNRAQDSGFCVWPFALKSF